MSWKEIYTMISLNHDNITKLNNLNINYKKKKQNKIYNYNHKFNSTYNHISLTNLVSQNPTTFVTLILK